jgi:hypothetical protein
MLSRLEQGGPGGHQTTIMMLEPFKLDTAAPVQLGSRNPYSEVTYPLADNFSPYASRRLIVSSRGAAGR